MEVKLTATPILKPKQTIAEKEVHILRFSIIGYLLRQFLRFGGIKSVPIAPWTTFGCNPDMAWSDYPQKLIKLTSA